MYGREEKVYKIKKDVNEQFERKINKDEWKQEVRKIWKDNFGDLYNIDTQDQVAVHMHTFDSVQRGNYFRGFD